MPKSLLRTDSAGLRATWRVKKYFLFSPLPGEMIQFDEHIFSNGLKPPTSKPSRCIPVFPRPLVFFGGLDAKLFHPLKLNDPLRPHSCEFVVAF